MRKKASTTRPRPAATSIRVSAQPQGTSFSASSSTTVPAMTAAKSSDGKADRLEQNAAEFGRKDIGEGRETRR